MNKILLSADSTCDLGDELKARFDVHYYPYHIILEGKSYQDNVDITTKDLFDAYYARKVLPQTSAINVGEYIDYFKPWVDEGYDILHFNLGGAISSSHKHCIIAASELNGHVFPIDSCSLSSGISLQIIEAANMIAQGKSAKEIYNEAKKLIPKCHASFILDTLDFMKAGGRCSSVTAFGANLLNLKPCIEVSNKDGSMGTGKKYRGSLEKVLVQYVRDKLSEYENIKQDHIFITASSIDQKYVDLVRKTITEIMPFKEIHFTDASCTIASHCGPNTLGILFMTE